MAYEARKKALLTQAAGWQGGGLRKRTSSNLFRYIPRAGAARPLDLREFRHCLYLDREARTLDVEGLATFQSIVDFTLAQGFVPRITPELKHITIGGATVGIGIESNCYRYGFVHDSLLEAEVLLPGGRAVLCRPDNEHADLFHALPNSYGTLGYILRAKILLMPAGSHVHLATTRHTDLDTFLDAMLAATLRPDVDFVEGLLFDEHRLYLTVSRFIDNPPRIDDIVRSHVFYKLILERPDVYLTTRDYLFRYDPEWFWNIPEGPSYQLFRRYAPKALRTSGFYKRYTGWKRTLREVLPYRAEETEEPLIQDWEVPWEQAAALTRFGLREVDLRGKPWIVTPIRTPQSPTIYPVRSGAMYYNLGCYCQVRKQPAKGPYWYTRIMDEECFKRGGLKMLYSSHFLSREEFDRIYNGAAYREVKRKYDPENRLGDLYNKTAMSVS